MPKPKVSVITAVYNGERTISKTIDSILNQTFKDFEYIIVDDAATDSTPRILSEYAKKDKRIKVITNEVNKERCISRNIAIEQSSGGYIAVTDADDISLPQRLQLQYEYLENHQDCYLLATRASLVDEDGKNIGKSYAHKSSRDITEELKVENRIVHSTIMYRNTKEVFYREKFKYAQDYDLFLQMISIGKRIHLIPEILVKYSDKRDLLYNEYLVKQKYFSEVSKYLLKDQSKYSDIDWDNMEKYVPNGVIEEMNFKKEFFNANYKEARKILKENTNYKNTLYMLDTYIGGNIHRVGKFVKRLFV